MTSLNRKKKIVILFLCALPLLFSKCYVTEQVTKKGVYIESMALWIDIRRDSCYTARDTAINIFITLDTSQLKYIQ